MHKKVLLIDLDGVLNEYAGNFDKDVMPECKKGAEEFLEKLSKDYDIKILAVIYNVTVKICRRFPPDKIMQGHN